MTQLLRSASMLNPFHLNSPRLTNLSDFVVVCQEHGQILRLLNGRGLGHLSEELGRSKQRQETLCFNNLKRIIPNRYQLGWLPHTIQINAGKVLKNGVQVVSPSEWKPSMPSSQFIFTSPEWKVFSKASKKKQSKPQNNNKRGKNMNKEEMKKKLFS